MGVAEPLGGRQYLIVLIGRCCYRNKLNSKKYGTKGEVTEQLALLLKALWACQYSPDLSTNFKQVVERHGSQYKGTQQHDALEFLQWLLDKVHEDLNTASKKKYKPIKVRIYSLFICWLFYNLFPKNINFVEGFVVQGVPNFVPTFIKVSNL